MSQLPTPDRIAMFANRARGFILTDEDHEELMTLAAAMLEPFAWWRSPDTEPISNELKMARPDLYEQYTIALYAAPPAQAAELEAIKALQAERLQLNHERGELMAIRDQALTMIKAKGRYNTERATIKLASMLGITLPVTCAPDSELEELRKDAERYRVLRDEKYQLTEDDINVSDSTFNTYFNEELDSLVDKLKARDDAMQEALP